MEKILNELEKRQKAYDVMNELKQTDEEKKEKEEDILDAAGREYTLASPGTLSLSYSIGYTVDTYDQLKQITNEDGDILTQVRHANYHSINNGLSLKVPILKNFSISSGVSYSFKYQDVKDDSKQANGLEDPFLNIQYQPFKPKEGRPNTILSVGLTFPLGSSPYENRKEDELSIGNGYYSMSYGVNLSKAIDPIIAYGGLSYSHAFTQSSLNYNPDEEQKESGIYIYKVKPGNTIGANIGMGYSLSYLVSISIGYQYSYSQKTEYYWKSSGKTSSSTGYSSSLSIGTNWKVSHNKSISSNLSIGLFSDNSDVSFNLSIPFEFKI